MLTKEVVINMDRLFFNGQPEEAYRMVNSMREWDQFIDSIKKDENQLKAYYIMAKSNLEIWGEHIPFNGDPELPSYEIG